MTRKEIAESFASIVNKDGSPFASKEWITENVLGGKNMVRKEKIKKINGK